MKILILLLLFNLSVFATDVVKNTQVKKIEFIEVSNVPESSRCSL